MCIRDRQEPQQKKVDVKDQLSSAVNAFKKKEENIFDDQHQFEAPTEFIKKDIEVPETINVGGTSKDDGS